MSDLTGQEIKETYKDLLHMNNGNTGVTSDLSRVFDGEGTGSALHLSDTEASVMGNLGVGTTSPSRKLQVHTDTNEAQTIACTSTLSGIDVQHASIGHGTNKDGNLQLANSAGNNQVYLTSNGDSYLNGGRVGIGTSSPSDKLEISNDNTNGVGDAAIAFTDQGGVRYTMGIKDGSQAFQISENSPLGQAPSDATKGTRFLIDTNGRVGIGTTSPSSMLHISGTSPVITLTDTDTNVDSNISADSSVGSLFINADINNEAINSAILLKVDGTEKMRVNSDGRVGIGTTNPSDKLDITGDINNLGISITNGAAGHPARVTLANNEGSGTIDANNGQLRLGNGSSGSNDLVIDSDGRVGIGTTSPSAQLHIIDAHGNGSTSASGQLKLSNISTNGGTWGIHTTADNWNAGGGGKLGFFADDNANQARMIITQAGNVGIGLTTPDCKLTVVTDNALSGYAMKIGAGGGGQEDRGLHIAAGRTVPNGAGQCVYIGFHDGDGTATGGIRCSANPSTPEFFSSSDIRMKKNIEDCDINGIEKIKSLKLRKWDWNTEKDMPPTDLGLIADELEEVYPELVSRQKMEGWEHCVSEGEEDLKTIPSESKITLTLVKAIQEQQTIIEDLKSRIVTLEGGSPEPDKAEEPVVEEVTEEPVAEETPVSIGASISGESLTEVSDSRAEEL
jgi:hypothetical protein